MRARLMEAFHKAAGAPPDASDDSGSEEAGPGKGGSAKLRAVAANGPGGHSA